MTHQPSPHIGQAWDDHFKDARNQYHFAEGLPFLRKFIRSPFIQLPVRYAYLPAQAQVLEAGCGSGKFSFALALLGHQVVALDFSTDILQNLSAARVKLEVSAGPLAVTPQHGDLENLTLQDNTFDLVINEGVVEHWLEQTARRRVLAHMARVAKPGGTVAVIIPNGNHPWVDFWMTKNPAFLAAPPMIKYTPTILRSDLEAVGLREIRTDGIYAWRNIDDWPRQQRVFQLLGSILQRLIPLPHVTRERWGLHLIGLGRKI